MPVIKSAIKKLRRDKKVEKTNNLVRHTLDRALKTAKKQKTASSVSKAFSVVDRALKKNLIHKNKAAHLKSALAKLARPATKTVIKTVAASKKVVSKATKTKTSKTAKAKK